MNIKKLKSFIIKKLEEGISPDLTYHGIEHTLLVLKACNQYIKRMKINPGDAYLLRTSAIMHDTGFLWSFDNHEHESIKYTKNVLPDWNYSEEEINKITGMILATRVPQKPKNILEQIMADSDLEKKFKELKLALKNNEDIKEVEKILKKHPLVAVGCGVVLGLALSKLIRGD